MAKQDNPLTEILSEEFTGALAESITPIAPPPLRASELKSRVMARIRGKKSFDLMTIRVAEGEWIILLPGVKKKILSEHAESGMQSYLLRMEPGYVIPPHDHSFDEESIMLEGDAMIGELALSTGDYHFAPKGSRHEQVSTQNGCLIFVRTY